VSANGTYVNGERISGTHRLARADVIRIGNDEFRFYADERRKPAVPAPDPAAAASAQPVGAAQRLSDTLHGIPVPTEASREKQPSPPPAAEAALASLLLRSGELKGHRLAIKVPVVNIGRGDYNDVVIADPSVSTLHAKLQRREAIWILTDLGSTNGTFVDGERLTGEAPLSPGTTIKFGDVTALFEPLDHAVPARRADSTRSIPRLDPAAKPAASPPPSQPATHEPLPAASGTPEVARPRPRPRRPIHMAPPRPKSPSTLTVVGLLILVAILAYLVSSS
jgi:pSer/pThr/pTyr-binding forkhead associated (FHA) protein